MSLFEDVWLHCDAALRVSRYAKSCLSNAVAKKGKTKGKKSIDFPLLPVKYLFVKFPSPLRWLHSWQTPPSSSTGCSLVTSRGPPRLPGCCLNCCTPSVSLLRLVYSDNRSLTFVRPHPAFAPPHPHPCPDCLLSSSSVNQWLLK